MTAHSFPSAVSTLLAEPILEGAFRIWDGQTDVTDEFSELRFRDPQLGGYLDRTRVERELLVRPLTVWLRGSWVFQRRHDEAVQDTATAQARLERNEWTLIVPPGAVVSITSPRRAFAVVTPVAGALAGEPPPPGVAGRTVEIQAAQTGVIAALDWHSELAKNDLARYLPINPTHNSANWHRSDADELVRVVRDQILKP